MTTKRSSISKDALKTIESILSVLNETLVHSYTPIETTELERLKLVRDIELSRVEAGLYREHSVINELSDYLSQFNIRIALVENDLEENTIVIHGVGIYNNLVKMEITYIMEFVGNDLIFRQYEMEKVVRIRNV